VSSRENGYILRELEVTAGPEVSFATALGHCSGTRRNDEIIEVEFHLTMGFRKRAGHWRIVHEHHSVRPLTEPFDAQPAASADAPLIASEWPESANIR
jgi:ketosteroid isomerase-like protein